MEAAEGEARRFELLVSERLLGEVKDVLWRPKMRRYLPERAVSTYLERLREAATVVEDPTAGFSGATADPDDDYLVALAAAPKGLAEDLPDSGAASYLVSGDRHLLRIPDRLVRDGKGGVLARVLTVREFLEELERASS